MGRKLACIIVSKQGKDQALLEAFGFGSATYMGESPFGEIGFAEEGMVYVGSAGSISIIAHETLPFSYVSGSAEFLDAAYFSDCEVCGLALYSMVNYFGFAVAVNGHVVRVKSGDAEHGLYIDEGEPQAEEQELLSQSFVDADGNRGYRIEDFPDEVLTEDQVGETFVEHYFKKYTGKSFGDFAPTVMRGYSL